MVLTVKVQDQRTNDEPRVFEYSEDVFACDYTINQNNEVNCTIIRREQSEYSLVELKSYLNTIPMRAITAEFYLDDILIAKLDNILMMNYNISNRPISLNDTLRDEVFELLRMKSLTSISDIDIIENSIIDLKVMMEAEFAKGTLTPNAEKLNEALQPILNLLNVNEPEIQEPDLGIETDPEVGTESETELEIETGSEE